MVCVTFSFNSRVELNLSKRWLSRSVDPSSKFVQNSTKITCLEITSYQINYSIVLWLLELYIRRG